MIKLLGIYSIFDTILLGIKPKILNYGHLLRLATTNLALQQKANYVNFLNIYSCRYYQKH